MARLTKPAYATGILNGDVMETYQSIYEDSTKQHWMLGTKLEFANGREFRYAKAGGTALVQARMCQTGITAATYFTGIVQTDYPRAVGDLDIRVLVTTGAIAGTATGYAEDAFSGGWLNCVRVSPAVLGDIYEILASKMVDETHIDLKLATPWRNAMLETGGVTLTVNKFYGTLVFAAYDATAPACGVPLCPVEANEFYWSQVKGYAPLIVDNGETYDIGCMISCPVTLGDAGEGGHHELTTAQVLRQPWGVCVEIATADEPGIVDLCLE